MRDLNDERWREASNEKLVEWRENNSDTALWVNLEGVEKSTGEESIPRPCSVAAVTRVDSLRTIWRFLRRGLPCTAPRLPTAVFFANFSSATASRKRSRVVQRGDQVPRLLLYPSPWVRTDSWHFLSTLLPNWYTSLTQWHPIETSNLSR